MVVAAEEGDREGRAREQGERGAHPSGRQGECQREGERADHGVAGLGIEILDEHEPEHAEAGGERDHAPLLEKQRNRAHPHQHDAERHQQCAQHIEARMFAQRPFEHQQEEACQRNRCQECADESQHHDRPWAFARGGRLFACIGGQSALRGCAIDEVQQCARAHRAASVCASRWTLDMTAQTVRPTTAADRMPTMKKLPMAFERQSKKTLTSPQMSRMSSVRPTMLIR